jgi:hypothetical protein
MVDPHARIVKDLNLIKELVRELPDPNPWHTLGGQPHGGTPQQVP